MYNLRRLEGLRVSSQGRLEWLARQGVSTASVITSLGWYLAIKSTQLGQVFYFLAIYTRPLTLTHPLVQGREGCNRDRFFLVGARDPFADGPDTWYYLSDDCVNYTIKFQFFTDYSIVHTRNLAIKNARAEGPTTVLGVQRPS